MLLTRTEPIGGSSQAFPFLGSFCQKMEVGLLLKKSMDLSCCPAHLATGVVIIVVQHLIMYSMPLTYWFLIISGRPMDLELHVIWDRFKIKLCLASFYKLWRKLGCLRSSLSDSQPLPIAGIKLIK